MFSSVLIANRGEIAVRIIRTCREMGIRPIAIYSDPDAGALHVQLADAAYRVGPAPALESYLNIDSVLAAARASGAGAVHPGYGFLAENARFARAVQAAGLVWIGPPPEVIALMGDKVAAKELAEDAGVPTVPGYMGEDQSPNRLLREAERIGYPIMIKAAAGGGGKGMRIVEEGGMLAGALEGAQREARSAFGDERVFLERLIEFPRHIEIQIMMDTRGGGVYLGERDCTLQRRHQKVIEEAPAATLGTEMRGRMGRAALALARRAGYVNAGTVEFLFDGHEFYFLEMNTRIQVEHPVTEMVTGLDLIRMQLEVAAGSELGLTQEEVTVRGHAIEARLYAENPGRDFLPATGTVALWRPAEGPGIRNDSALFDGAEVLPWYDPMLGKVIVQAETRAEAIDRLVRAMRSTVALGTITNQAFLIWLADSREFRESRVDTGYIERVWAGETPLDQDLLALAAAAFDLLEDLPRTATGGAASPWKMTGGWRVGGGERTLAYSLNGERVEVRARRLAGGDWSLTSGELQRQVHLERPNAHTLVLREGTRVQTFHGARLGEVRVVSFEGQTLEFSAPGEAAVGGASAGGKGHESLTAPMPGTVVKVAVVEGDLVSAHEPLVVLEAMKMEHVVVAPQAGVVSEVLCAAGDLVQGGQTLVRMEAE